VLAGGDVVRFAYADPPYEGCAHLYRAVDNPDASEVDHAALVARLCRDYPNGWALSAKAGSVRTVLPLCPTDVQVGVWVRTNAPPHQQARVHKSWEPVLYRGGRPRRRGTTAPSVRDALIAPAHRLANAERFLGAKPEAFTFWVLGLLGVEAGDVVDDLFPGSGGVGRAVDRYLAQASFAGTWYRRQDRPLRNAKQSGQQPRLEEVTS
jgi:hypothetical protein